jgi:replication-associated recombination protein RarA
MQIRTLKGYDFFEISSCCQKAIRRGDVKMAAFAALELVSSGFSKYVWRRLFTISAEDCFGCITQEINALHIGYKLANEKSKRDNNTGRIFISKAIVLLCLAKKSRDADHLQNLVTVSDDEINEYMSDLPEYIQLPNYIYDVHTKKGKQSGRTKKDFFVKEHNALNNRIMGLFDYSVDELAKSNENELF